MGVGLLLGFGAGIDIMRRGFLRLITRTRRFSLRCLGMFGSVWISGLRAVCAAGRASDRPALRATRKGASCAVAAGPLISLVPQNGAREEVL